MAGSTTTAFNAPKGLALAASTWHLVDLGEMVLPPGTIEDGWYINPLRLELQAKVTGEPNKVLNIDCLYLLDNDVLAGVLLAQGTSTWSQGALVLASTFEREARAWAIDSGSNLAASLVMVGDAWFLPIRSSKTLNLNHITHAVINCLMQRDAGGHVLTDRWSALLAYVPQYLFPVV